MKTILHEPLDLDRARYDLQKSQRDLRYSSHENVGKKRFFFKKLIFVLFFAGVSLLGTQFSCSVVITEANPNNDTVTCQSQTADFSAAVGRRKAMIIPFERGASKDYAYIKLIEIECKLAAHEVQQDK